MSGSRNPGLATGFAGSFQTLSPKDAITAFATGGQAGAVPLTAMVNTVTVCATAGDSVALPASVAGMRYSISHVPFNPEAYPGIVVPQASIKDDGAIIDVPLGFTFNFYGVEPQSQGWNPSLA